MDPPSSEDLRQLSYFELKQYAKKRGVKKTNMKAERLISAILSASTRANDTIESFTTCDESLDNSFLDQIQVTHEVANIGNSSSGRKSRRITQILSGKMTPELSFVPKEITDTENTSSRRRSRRLAQIHSAESSPEGNSYSSGDSEIEIKTPVISSRKTEMSSEIDVSSVGNNYSSGDSEIEVKTPVISSRKTEMSSEIDVSSVESKSSSEDSEIELKTPMSILKRSTTFCVEEPVTPVEKQPNLNDMDLDISASEQHKLKVASRKKVSIAPMAKPDFSDDNEVDTVSEDQTYVLSGHPPPVTPAKPPRRSILRHGKKSIPSKNGKSSGNKVNFVTPDRMQLRRSNSETPLKSVKGRPKTPIAARNSVKRKRFPSPFPEKSLKYARGINDHSTPRLADTIVETKITLDKGLQAGTPMAKSMEKKPTAIRTCGGRKELTTPSLSAKKKNPLEPKKLITPNFKEIHQKAFERMENLQEYQKRVNSRMATLTRSQQRSRKEVPSSTKKSAQKKNPPQEISNPEIEFAPVKPSRIPQPFRGIPFIPAVKSIRKINTNFVSHAQSQSFVRSTSKSFVGNENANLSRKCYRSLFTPKSDDGVFRFGRNQSEKNPPSVASEKRFQTKFDLKASLAKKLPYKPYRGILKPLTDSNANQSQLNASCIDHIKIKREKSREVLKGVRKNRRFDLQMSRRGIS